jgi:hypothetical protein
VEQAGPREYEVGGWESPQVSIYDISDPASPRHLTTFESVQSDAGWIVRFRSNNQVGDRLWLQAQTDFVKPASIALRPPLSELRRPPTGSDVVIITSPALEPGAQQLAEWHRSRGFTSRVVLFPDLVDEFNFGVYHPRAITRFLAWTQARWPEPQPRYVVLFGDGNWNFKGYNPELYPIEPIHIPPYLSWDDPWQGEVPSDNRYVDLDDDGKPDLALGRIPVNNLEEAQAVINKLREYDETRRDAPWERRAVFVADDAIGGDFAGLSDSIIAHQLPADLTPQRIYLNRTYTDTNAVRLAIADSINQGAFMLQYAGHGSPSTWMKGVGWSLEDIDQLNNAGRYPFVSTYNCLDGYFAYPGRPSIAEVMLRKPNAGSIAAISPTGLGTTFIQHVFREILMELLFQEDVRTLGDALLLGKQRFYERYGRHYLIETMTLFGDPTLQLPREFYASYAFWPLSTAASSPQAPRILAY